MCVCVCVCSGSGYSKGYRYVRALSARAAGQGDVHAVGNVEANVGVERLVRGQPQLREWEGRACALL